MTTFLNELARGTNLTTTENGAVTNKSSLDPVVDFFGLAGAKRHAPNEAADLFETAFNAEPLTAIRTLFYLRDIRGGQGERDIFRACIDRLNTLSHATAAQVAQFVPEYGRWDDLFFGFPLAAILPLIKGQLIDDAHAFDRNQPVSLLAKWMPSMDASSKRTVNMGWELSRQLGMTPRQYRLVLSKLRARIRLLEQDMSTNNWNGIDFSKLPSQAHRKHVKAFKRHTPERYQAYLDSVTRGEAKINVSAVYPHEIYKMAHENYANVAWNNLPDYTRGNNALVMADVSGSMVQPYNSANPIAVSVSLALYFAERNKGAFHNHFMTFSSDPQLVQVRGNTLADKMRNIANSEWGMKTDLLAAFRAILSASTRSGEEPPSTLYIISDMEFDQATPTGSGWRYVTRLAQTPFGPRLENARVYTQGSSHDTIFETAKREYAAAGLELPHVVFWNVEARQNQAPATILDGQVSLVSGLSPTIFAQVVEGKSPRQLVDEVVNSERYERIIL